MTRSPFLWRTIRIFAALALLITGSGTATGTPTPLSEPQIDEVPLGQISPDHAAISPDGRFTYLSGTSYETDPHLIRVVDNTRKVVSATYKLSLLSTDQYVRAITLSRNGKQLYALTANRVLELDTGTGALTATVLMPEVETLATQVLSPDGRFLYLTSTDYRGSGVSGIHVVDLKTKAVVGRRTPAKRPHVSAALVSPDSTRLYLTTGEGAGSEAAIETYDVTTTSPRRIGDLVLRPKEPIRSEALNSPVLSRDGRWLYAENLGQELVVIDLVRNAWVHTVQIAPYLQVTGVALRADESAVYLGVRQRTEDDGPTVAVVDTKTFHVVDTLTGFTDDDVTSLIADPGNERLHVGTAHHPGTGIYFGTLQP